MKKYRIVESALTDSEIRELSRQVYLEEYASLYEDEREKLLLPYLKKNPELMKKYNDCVAEYEQSMHGQIYDPVTETFEYTKGKLNIRRFDTKLVLLKNGNVLIMGGQTPRDNRVPIGIADEGMSIRAGRMEIYNPETETFSLVNNTTPIYNVVDAFLLKDGRVFIIYSGKYTIYDPEKNIFSETGRLIKYKQHLKLSDDKILFFVGPDTTFETFKLPKHSHNHQSYLYYFKEYNISEIVIYDINKKEYKDGGWLADGLANNRYVSGVGTNLLSTVIAGAYQCGIRDFDTQLAYEACLKNELDGNNRPLGAGKVDTKEFVTYGYVPHQANVLLFCRSLAHCSLP